MKPKTAQQQVKQQQYFISISCKTYADLLLRDFRRAAASTTPAFTQVVLRDSRSNMHQLMQLLQQLMKMP
jgi:hypothetical protein